MEFRLGEIGHGGYIPQAVSSEVADMTKLFLKGIEAVKTLSAEQQDLAGEVLLSMAAEPHRLSPEQLADLEIGIAEADRGEFATDDEVAAMWKKFGL
jgi:hypothetical protein